MRGRWGIALAMLVGCGGSTVSPGGDAGGADAGGGVDSGFDAPILPFDAGHPGSDATADVGTVTKAYDGTTGQMCTTDGDCQPPGGPGNALCSPTVFTPETYYPTAVCILPTCSPVSGTTLHYCDGPDDPSSPGICVPQTTGGICLPKCTFDKMGSPAVGCVGKDVCDVYTSNTAGGVGYCWAGCTQDGDCATGQHCQTDQGLCMEGVVPPTKAFGAACTQADSNAGACNCLYGGTAMTGYCSDFCIVGGAATCPAGSVCDGLEYRQYGYTMNNSGLAGYCSVACSAGDAGPACPPNSSCTNVFAAGPDCVP